MLSFYAMGFSFGAMDAESRTDLTNAKMIGRTCQLQDSGKGGNARWVVGKVMRGGNGRFRAEVAGDLPVG